MIRPATLADLPGLAAAIRSAYAPFVAAGIDLPAVDQGLADDLRDNHVWVATGRDRVLGGVVLSLGDHAHLVNLAVHPDGAGQGLGRKLIDVAMAAARDAGYARILLATHKDMTATQRFYARRGWVETGREAAKIYFEHPL